nr:hypothetical protein CFP56_44908 [Quercus suber]
MIVDNGESFWNGKTAWNGLKLRMGDDGELPLGRAISIRYLQVLYPGEYASGPLFNDFWTRKDTSSRHFNLTNNLIVILDAEPRELVELSK